MFVDAFHVAQARDCNTQQSVESSERWYSKKERTGAYDRSIVNVSPDLAICGYSTAGNSCSKGFSAWVSPVGRKQETRMMELCTSKSTMRKALKQDPSSNSSLITCLTSALLEQPATAMHKLEQREKPEIYWTNHQSFWLKMLRKNQC